MAKDGIDQAIEISSDEDDEIQALRYILLTMANDGIEAGELSFDEEEESLMGYVVMKIAKAGIEARELEEGSLLRQVLSSIVKDGIEAIQSMSDEELGSLHRYFISKMESVLEHNEEDDDDCVILEYNPFLSFTKLSINDDQDLSVIAEQDQVVACRDYPHPRHLCAKFPFNKTTHDSFCEQCYCYVCDSIAPCKSWTGVPMEHCHATDHEPKWKVLKRSERD